MGPISPPIRPELDADSHDPGNRHHVRGASSPLVPGGGNPHKGAPLARRMHPGYGVGDLARISGHSSSEYAVRGISRRQIRAISPTPYPTVHTGTESLRLVTRAQRLAKRPSAARSLVSSYSVDLPGRRGRCNVNTTSPTSKIGSRITTSRLRSELGPNTPSGRGGLASAGIGSASPRSPRVGWSQPRHRRGPDSGRLRWNSTPHAALPWGDAR